MNPLKTIGAICAMLLFAACSSIKTGSHRNDGKIEIVLVQVNDVYEISPIRNEEIGGLARVATLKKQYQQTNPNTLLIMAGDFLSPSIYNKMKLQGKPVIGKQMVEAMNTAGFDLAGFGNHEFDLDEADLQERINESSFQWVSSNSFQIKNGKEQSFQKISGSSAIPLPTYVIRTLKDADGTTARVGFIGINIPKTKKKYVAYQNPLSAATTIYNKIKDSCDAIVAITHQELEQDIQLAKQLPALAAIIGGHEHDMRFEKVGNVYITKAHSNAVNAYVVKLQIDTKSRTVITPKPELKELDNKIAFDNATSNVVNKWWSVVDTAYGALGFNSREILLKDGAPFDARDSVISITSSNFTKLICTAMAEACPDADATLFNAGSIRVDEMLMPPITQYTIMRAMPYGGSIRQADITGKLLIQVLEAGKKNSTTGGFLQYSSTLSFSNGKWLIHGKPIDEKQAYKIALNDFLIEGQEQNLGFLNEKNYEVYRLYNKQTSPQNPQSDIRLAVIKYMERMNGKL